MLSFLRVLCSALAVICLPTLILAQVANVSLGEPATDPDAPIEVTSEALSVDRESGNAIFTGDVFVVQGEMTLNADEVEVFYSEDPEAEEQLEKVVATGNVVLVNGADSAEGERGVFYPPEDRVVMTGNVLLTQERSIVSGDIFNWDMTTGQGTMEGRVRTVLQQRAKE